jgi:hypothetical protein
MKRRTALKNTAWMMGGIFSASAIATLFDSCVAPAEGDVWTPNFLTVDQGKIVTQIADILIPTTDTPGAVDALVPQFIDLVAKTLLSPDDQKQLTAGFAGFDEKCKKEKGKSFLKCSDEEQLAFLQSEDKAFVEGDGPSFFGTMKESIYRGYFSSEVGATEVLKFDPVPGNYDGCVPLSEIGGTWAT